MKKYIVVVAVMALIAPISSFAYSAFKVNDDVDPRFGSMNDGFTAMRFESEETHGYYRSHGYYRDEGYQDNHARFGYAWEKGDDAWNTGDWSNSY